MVNLLIHSGVKPLIVFDGDRLPAKSGQEESRHQFCFLFSPFVLIFWKGVSTTYFFFRRREENKQKAFALLRTGDRSGASEFFQKCVDVTPEMAARVIRVHFF